MDKYTNKNTDSIFYQHIREKHNNEMQELDVKLLASAPGDAMLRQVTEAIYIKEKSPDLNKKEEFGNSNAPRVRRRSVNESSQAWIKT